MRFCAAHDDRFCVLLARSHKANAQRARTEMRFTGHLDDYRLVDQVWTWNLSASSFVFTDSDGQSVTVHSPKVKVIAMKNYEQGD